MKLLDKLNTLFRHYDNAEFPLPMVDTFDRSDQDYRYITIAAPSFISEYAKKDAEKWATQIHDNPEEFLESRISRLKDYFAYADKCEREARKQDDSTDMAYRSLAYCFYECAVFHAAVLYRECYKQKMICADIFFIPGAELSDIFRQIGLWDFQESRQYLCQHCSKDCNHRCSQPLETITQTTKNGGLNNATSRKSGLLDAYPGIRTFFERLATEEYLNADYSLNCSHSLAAIIAHEMGKEFSMPDQCKLFEEFWSIRDNLSRAYLSAKSNSNRWKQDTAKSMLQIMFRKQMEGISNLVPDTPKIDSAMKELE